MKVLHVIDSGGLYGAERIVLSLMKAHQAQGIEVELVSIAEPGLLEKAIETEAGRMGLKWRRFTLKSGPDIKGMRKVVGYALEQNMSLIHSHTYKPNTLLAMLPGKSRPIPILATLHGWTSGRRWSRVRWYEIAERALLPRLDKVVAVTDAMLSGTRLKKRLGERLIVIRNAIEQNPAEKGLGQELEKAKTTLRELADGRVAFVMIGRLSPEKDIATCLIAIKILEEQGNGVSVFLFGEGPERDALKKLTTELGIEKQVFFMGFIDDVQLLLREFRALIISSLTEGLPLVALEAMLSKIPVISTTVGGLPEVVINEKSGLLVKPQDPQGLAMALDRFANDEQKARELGEAGYRRLLEQFAFTTFSKSYLNQYRALA